MILSDIKSLKWCFVILLELVPVGTESRFQGLVLVGTESRFRGSVPVGTNSCSVLVLIVKHFWC